MKTMTRTLALTVGIAVILGGGTAAFALTRSGKSTTAAGRSGIAFGAGSGASVVDWNKELLDIVKAPGNQPATVHPTRSFALLHAAMYDAVVSVTHADQPYTFEVSANPGARPDAAADQAAHDVLAALYPSVQPALDQLLNRELAALPSGQSTQDGLRVGRTAAVLMLAERASDGSAATRPPFALPPAQPGTYQLTPPNHPAPVFTSWGSVAPFVLTGGDQFRPPAPPALTSSTWAQAINEVQSLGRDTSTTRTADQTEIGKFWAPPIWNTWNEIAEGEATARRTNLEDTAKMFADLNLSFADTAIAFYDAKYHYLLWRPITAIQAGTPGNAQVTADATWNALATTAADPSYPGAHSAISGAAAVVLSRFFGNRVELFVHSDALSGVTRQFATFQDAATEAGLSRIFAGQHTRIDHEAGLALGRDVATFVLKDATSPGF